MPARSKARVIYHYYYFGDQAKTGENSNNVELHYFSNQDPGAFVSISGGGVLASSKHPKEAQAFLKWITGKGGQDVLKTGTSFEYAVGNGAESNPKLVPLADLQAPKVEPSKLNSKKVTDLMTAGRPAVDCVGLKEQQLRSCGFPQERSVFEMASSMTTHCVSGRACGATARGRARPTDAICGRSRTFRPAAGAVAAGSHVAGSRCRHHRLAAAAAAARLRRLDRASRPAGTTVSALIFRPRVGELLVNTVLLVALAVPICASCWRWRWPG